MAEYCERCHSLLSPGALGCWNCGAETPLARRDPNHGLYQGIALGLIGASALFDKYRSRNKVMDVSEYHLQQMQEAFDEKNYALVVSLARPIWANRRLYTNLEARYRYLFGAAYYMLGKYQEAYKLLSRWALEPDPSMERTQDHPRVLLTFAGACMRLLVETGEDVFQKEGLSAIDKAIDLDPSNSSYKDLRAALLAALSR